MRKAGFTFLLSTLMQFVIAQGLINNSANIVLGSNSHIVIKDTVLGNFENRGIGLVTNTGTIKLEGNWLNNGNNPVFTSNEGTVELSGGDQLIAGSTTTSFYNLVLTGTGIKKLMLSTAVGGGYPLNRDGILDLKDRVLNLNSNTLLLTNSSEAVIQRSSGYVLGDSAGIPNGDLAWRTGFAVNAKNYLIPFGRTDGTYVPLSLNFTGNGGGSDTSGFIVSTYGTNASASPGNRPFPPGVSNLNNPYGIDHSENSLDRYWIVQPFGFGTPPPGNMIFGYADDEWDKSNGSENIIFENELGLISYVSGNWQFPPAGSADTLNNRLSVSGTSPFGIFMLANPVECPKSWFSFNKICQEENALFSDSSVFRKGYLTGYNWDFGDASVSIDSFPLHSFTGFGNYTVSHRVTLSSGCSDSVQRIVKVDPKPLAQYDFTGRPCLNSLITFNDLSTTPLGSITNRSWDFGNGQQSGVSNPQVTYNSASVYQVQLIVENSFACSDTLSRVIPIFNNPIAQFSLSDLCSRDSAFMINTSQPTDAPLVSFSWDLGDGTGSIQKEPHKKYSLPGNYTIQLMVTDSNNCIDSVSGNINVFQSATAEFDFDPKNADFLKPEVNFYNQSFNSNSWSWQFGDGSFGNGFDEVHTFPDTGFYKVLLTANNAFNCPDSISHNVYIEPVFLVFIPTAFTPNTDLLNETFGPDGLPMGAHNCKFSIYNRWGQVIFRSNDLKDRWNGTYQGNPVQPGTYAYEFVMDDYRGRTHYYRGMVTLLR